jgi:protein O-mannosyl-transferase
MSRPASRPGRARPRASARAAPSAARAAWRRPEWLGTAGSLALAALVLAVYRGALANGFVSLDDTVYVVGNALVRQQRLGELLRLVVSHNWHPLTLLTLAWNAGEPLSPRPFLLGNVLLHAANSVLVSWLAWVLSGRRAAVAAFSGLVFALHPMHVESVAWISERKDVLHALFWLGAALAYALHLERPRPRLLGLALVSFVLACLAKGAAVSFPLAMVAMDLWKRRPLLARRAVLEKLPFLAVALLFGAIALDVQKGGTFHGLLVAGPATSSAIRTVLPHGLAARLLMPAAGAMVYVARLFVPVGTAAFHPYPSPAEWASAPWRLAPVALLALVALAVWDLRRTRILSFAAAWFLATIVFVLQWVPVGMAITADRYAYLPYVGLAFGWGMGMDRLAARVRVAGLLAWIASAAFVVALVPLTVRQVATWHDSEALWSRVLEVHPRSGRAWAARGNARLDQGRTAEAASDLSTAYRLGDRGVSTLDGLGIVEAGRGHADSALALFGAALAAVPTNEPSYENRALVLARLGRLSEARADLDRAFALTPGGSARLFFMRGIVRAQLGDRAGGAADLDQAIASGMANPDAFLQRGQCRLGLGDRAGAERDFRQVLRLAPGHPGAVEQLRGMGLDPGAGR